MTVEVSNGSGGRLLTNGTRSIPNAIVAADGVSILNVGRELQFIVGSGGAVVVTADPRIQAGTVIGQELQLLGTSDTNTVTLQNGNGLILNGAAVLKNGSSLYVVWDGSDWNEIGRNDV